MQLELRIEPSIEAVPAPAWDNCAGSHPFARHALLQALERSGAMTPERGVVPRHALLLHPQEGVVACAPGMLKWGNKREFGQEIRWLEQGLAEGCFAWPKFQLGVPFFAAPGPRLLVRPDLPVAAVRSAFLDALMRTARQEPDLAVFNLMHLAEVGAAECAQHGALLSCEWHAVWRPSADVAGGITLQQYLDALHWRHRSRFRRERQQALSHGLAFRVLHGAQIDAGMVQAYFDGHRRVCERHGGRPWLPVEAYQAIVQAVPEHTMLLGYFDGEQLVAGILGLIDIDARALYLLQWSESARLAGVAMDLICRRPIEYALEHGLLRVESGIAAPHKALRGWATVPVHHAHWFHNVRLQALAIGQLAEAASAPILKTPSA